MASYADYVKDDLNNEIEQSAQETQKRTEQQEANTFVVPDRFKGKTQEEVITAYEELEKLNSRQGNDLGSMRKTVDELIALQSPNPRPQEVEESAPVTVDDLYENAEEAISRVAEKKVSGRIEALENQLKEAQVKAQLATLDTKFPDWRTRAQDPEFLNWVADNSYRQTLANAADQYDFDAAEALFGMYDDLKGNAEAIETKQLKEKQLKDASMESSGPGVVDTAQTYSRTDIIEAKVAAKRGDSKAREWLQANNESIALAYEQGHITD